MALSSTRWTPLHQLLEFIELIRAQLLADIFHQMALFFGHFRTHQLPENADPLLAFRDGLLKAIALLRGQLYFTLHAVHEIPANDRRRRGNKLLLPSFVRALVHDHPGQHAGAEDNQGCQDDFPTAHQESLSGLTMAKTALSKS